MRAWLCVLAAAGCDATIEPRIDRATPPYGPLVGGTRITVAGAGFAGAEPTRVLIGGREAPLVATVDDATLEVVIPPGAQPGDAELVVWNDRGNRGATGVFRYSAPPTITAVEPADVLFSSTATRMTVTGSGFLDEAAGDVTLAVDGWAVGVDVVSDTRLEFTAPPGRALVRPDVELADRRGRAFRTRAFRYTPSPRPGLLLFPLSGGFATFFDPADGATVAIPWIVAPAPRFTSVVRDDHGDYWATDRNRRFGRIDMKTQRLEVPLPMQAWFPTMIRIGADHFAIDRGSQRFGRFDPLTGAFTAIGAATLPCCGSYGLASSGAATYVTTRQGTSVAIATLDLATGATGPPVTLAAPSGFHVEEMRFFAGTLYASTRNGTLVTIDPALGKVTTVPGVFGRWNAMEVYD